MFAVRGIAIFILALSFTIVLTLIAMVLMTPLPANAKGAGAAPTVTPSHHGHHMHRQHHHWRQWYAPPAVVYSNDDRYYRSSHSVPVPATDPVPVVPTYSLRCTKSQSVVLVPSEEGGMREVTVTRC